MTPTPYQIPHLPLSYAFETVAILKQLNNANKKLAELKGLAASIPNEQILISTITLQEAKNSSEIENIVTTQDDLYRDSISLNPDSLPATTKEVLNYREALQHGFNMVRARHVLTNNIIKEIQQHLEHNKAGFRTVPGTQLKRQNGTVVYEPPQDNATIINHMSNLERFINDDTISDLDPLIKMAIIHHQFESIHPFYDGNGRTGRIINVLFLVLNNLLDLPILYISRYITKTKQEYYQHIQAIRDTPGDNSRQWEEWILYMLKAVEATASETIMLVKGISRLMAIYKTSLRPLFGKAYKHELLNNLFFHPYTKLDFFQREMQISRQTAAKYLDKIADAGLLQKIKIGRENYYVNKKLMDLLSGSESTNSIGDLFDSE